MRLHGVLSLLLLLFFSFAAARDQNDENTIKAITNGTDLLVESMGKFYIEALQYLTPNEPVFANSTPIEQRLQDAEARMWFTISNSTAWINATEPFTNASIYHDEITDSLHHVKDAVVQQYRVWNSATILLLDEKRWRGHLHEVLARQRLYLLQLFEIVYTKVKDRYTYKEYPYDVEIMLNYTILRLGICSGQ